MTWSRLKALPPYLGGKRRLLGHIFKHLPNPAEAPVFVDAFLGGGSVSLLAKARGYRVICNDIALRSYVVGKALIENSSVRLNESDIVRLFAANDNGADFISRNFSPDVVPAKHAQFMDKAMAAIRQTDGVKRWLFLLLIVKYILQLRPMGNFGAKTIMHQIEDKDWDRMNPNYLKDITNRNIYGHPKTILERLMKNINKGVFDNGNENVAHQKDVFEFLKGVEGDILYLDPPYAGTASYESVLKPLDSMLEGRMIKPEASVFSRKNAMEWLEKLFEASKGFPLWVISYGNAKINLDDLANLIRKFKRDVKAEEFRYTHLAAFSGEGLRERNREYLIIARG